MTSISYHWTVNDLQGYDWSNPGPFARPDWFALFEQHRTEPLIVLAREGDDAVAVPLLAQDGHLTALTNWYAFTFAELHTANAPSQLLAAITRNLAKRAHRIDLVKLAAEDGTLARLRDAFAQAGWIVFAEPCDTNHILHINGRNYSGYIADRPGQLRTTLKRKAKKVDVTRATNFDAADWAAYEAIYAESWKPEEGDPALLRQVSVPGIIEHDTGPVTKRKNSLISSRRQIAEVRLYIRYFCELRILLPAPPIPA